VGTAITNRMLRVVPPLSQADLIKKSGVSEATVRPLMKGLAGNYRPITLGKVAVALGWTPGSLERIRDGETPIDLNDGEVSDGSVVTFPGGDRALVTSLLSGGLEQLSLKQLTELLVDGLARETDPNELEQAIESMKLLVENLAARAPQFHLHLAADEGNPDVERAPGHPSADVEPEPEGP
jgi:hypothetical protein